MKKVLILVALAALAFSSGMAQSCDTLFNLQSNLDTAIVLSADTGYSGGYLAGNNVYGDLAKAEAFPVADSGFYLTSATYYFGYVAINATDSNNTVTLTVWDDSGSSLSGGTGPGNVIDSMQVTLGQIAQAVGAGEGLQVFFSSDSIITTDIIYVGLVLPTTAGDTVALLTNAAPPGPDGNGWELNSTGGWNTYNADWNVTSGSLGNYIIANICPTPPAPTPPASFTIYIAYSHLCSPAEIYFSDNNGNSASYAYNYSFGDGSYSNAQNPTHQFTTGGTYTITETVTNNTGSVIQILGSATGTVTVASSPVITAISIPADTSGFGSAYITVTGGTGHYFTTWSDGTLGDTITETAGTYGVTVADQNGCSATDSVTISSPAGIVSLSWGLQLSIFPNPASDVLNLIWSQKADTDIAIVDMDGKVVSTLTTHGDMHTVYDIHNLATGAYILRITDRANSKQHSIAFSKL